MIELINVSKTIKDKVIIKEISHIFLSGTLSCVSGESGSGKSTLLNIMGLLDLDFKGKVLIRGEDIRGLSVHKREKFIRENINYLFQNFALIDNISVFRNLKLVEKSKAKIIEALIKVGLNESFLDSPVFTLSGGEQQRVSLARCILKKGSIILADEPTGNLDEVNAKLIMDILKERARNGDTVIVVTHNPKLIKTAEQTLLLKKDSTLE